MKKLCLLLLLGATSYSLPACAALRESGVKVEASFMGATLGFDTRKPTAAIIDAVSVGASAVGIGGPTPVPVVPVAH